MDDTGHSYLFSRIQVMSVRVVDPFLKELLEITLIGVDIELGL